MAKQNPLRLFPTLIIGSGPVGMTLARCFREQDLPLLGITSRQGKKARLLSSEYHTPVCTHYLELVPEAKLIFIAVNDQSIEAVAEKLYASGKLQPGTFLAHLSGALSSRSLKKAEAKIHVFSLHPLQSFPAYDPKVKDLKGIPLIFEGDTHALPLAKNLAKALHGSFFEIREKDKVLYHTAASIASNFFVTLISLASSLNKKAGVPEKKALSILFPILHHTLANVEKLGLPQALTGPVPRGDLSTIKKHLDSLKKEAPYALNAYRALTLLTLQLAEDKGLPKDKAEAIRKVLRSTPWEK